MRTKVAYVASLLACLMVGVASVGCADTDEYQSPQMPPPPPMAAPPGEPPVIAPGAGATVATTSAQGTPPPPPGAPPATAAGGSSAQPLPALPSQAPQYAPDPSQQPQAQDQGPPPPQSQYVYSYPTGQWVYASGYGWMWVPNGAETEDMEGVPYTYIYTPSYGWTWYVSPWGVGPYHYGVWVSHPWHPVGWRGGWVAHPRVVGHFGGPRYYGGGRGGYHGHGRR